MIRTARPARPAGVQYDNWKRRAAPPVEQVRDGVWSIPTVIPDNPLRYVMAYAVATLDGLVLIDTGWDSPESWAGLVAGIKESGHTIDAVTDVLLTTRTSITTGSPAGWSNAAVPRAHACP